MKRVFNLVAAFVLAASLGSVAVQPAQASAGSPAGVSFPKGSPTKSGVTSNTSKSTLSATTDYYYNTADQSPVTGTTGVYANGLVASPTGVATGASHSLTEISVQSSASGSLRNIVEVGWSVSQGQFGDNNPHFFVYWWKNGVGQCYNGCGFVPWTSPTITVGASMASVSGTLKQFSILHTGGAWWIGYDAGWVGYYPDSLWTSATPSGPGVTFNTVSYYQVFGEIAKPAGTALSTICEDMGNGLLGSSTATLPGRWASTMLVTPAGNVDASLSTGTNAYPTYWMGTLTTAKSYRFGGPGAC